MVKLRLNMNKMAIILSRAVCRELTTPFKMHVLVSSACGY